METDFNYYVLREAYAVYTIHKYIESIKIKPVSYSAETSFSCLYCLELKVLNVTSSVVSDESLQQR